MAWEGKKYKLISSKNFDTLLKAYGLSPEAVQKVESSLDLMSVSKDGDRYVLTREIAGKVLETKFKLGEEFDDQSVDGGKIKALITAEGSGFRYVRKPGDGKDNVSTFKFEGNSLVLVTTIYGTDIVSTRTYEAI